MDSEAGLGNEAANSEDEMPLHKKPKTIIDDSSSSDSDLDDYLQKPQDLNLNSTFFKVVKTPVKPKESIDLETLSDSDSDDPLSHYISKNNKSLPSTSKQYDQKPNEAKNINYESGDNYNTEAFAHLNKQMQELKDLKKYVAEYEKRKQGEKLQDAEVHDLLAAGEKFDVSKNLADLGLHPSDFESGNESDKDDWEEVEDSPEKNLIPKEGVQITVEFPNAVKKKKAVDIMAAIKRRMNRNIKERQVLVHKVHLLCWIAHGNYVNNVINQDNILALALSLLPSKDCYPQNRPNLKYLEQFCSWYSKSMQCKFSKEEDNAIKLEDEIEKGIAKKEVTKPRILIYIFVAILRAMGLQCRLVLSLQVEPLRPPASELCSLANDKKADTSKEKKDVKAKKEDDGIKKVTNIKDTKTTNDISKRKSDKNNKTKRTNLNEEVMNAKQMKLDESNKTPTKKHDINSNINVKNVELKSSEITTKTKGRKPQPSQKTKVDNKSTKIKISKSESNLEKAKINERPSTSRKSNPSAKDIESPPLKLTRSRTKKTVEKDSSQLNINNETTITRSKSTSNIKNVAKTTSKLDIPKTKDKETNKTKRSKSDSRLAKDIDKKVLELEALEQSNSKPNLSKLKSFSSTDENGDDIATWRRSKSPKVPGQKTKTKECPKQSEPKTKIKESPKQSTKPEASKRIPRRKVPQTDGQFDYTSSSEDENNMEINKTISLFNIPIMQLDGADDKPTKPKLKALTKPASSCNIKEHSLRLKEKQSNIQTESKKEKPYLKKLKSSPGLNRSQRKAPSSQDSLSESSVSDINSTNESKFFITPTKNTLVKDIIIDLVKKGFRRQQPRSSKLSPGSYKEESDSSDFVISKKNQKDESESDFVPPKENMKVKRRVLPRSKLEELEKEKAEMGKQKTKGIDVWVEVFLDEEEKWICADLISGKVHCIKDIYNKASHPMTYVLSWDNTNRIKDVTKRYCTNWNTVTRKLRVEPKWWEESLKGFVGKKTAKDREEDEDLARLQLDQPLPKTISEYKDHPLYVLQRHLLKFQALYPPEPLILGYIRNEPVYSRDCVHTLHSRDIWLKYAKVVKLGEKPYKIVKARPKYDKLSNSMITDQLLEIFGEWQVEDYDPPTAENGIVPRNAYGNVELFKPCMLPKKCVHLQLPGLNKIARKLNIDCASAVTGFDFHGGWNHAIYDGFVVCEEFKDTLIAAWEQEQEEIVKREREKYEKRVYGNWRRLIKAAFIREKLKRRYNFSDKKSAVTDTDDILNFDLPEEEVAQNDAPPKKKRPKFMSRK